MRLFSFWNLLFFKKFIVQQRYKSFKFDDVFWLPAVRGVVPGEDTLFADLVEYTKLMMKVKEADHHDIYITEDDEDSLECRERIDIELEGRKCLLAIDSRQFRNKVASESLENFLGELLNNSDLDIKIILINLF